MPSKKIACLGAGSGYFMSALGDLLIREELRGSEITLYDIDRQKTELVEKMGLRLTAKAATGIKVRACTKLAEAIDGADFAISSIGGSGATLGGVYASAVQQMDKIIPAKYGVYQIIGDTGGPGGMMMGLRNIPVYLGICHEMEKRCPDVVFINHSNPMAILCRAMIKYSGIKKVIGICHGVQAGIVNIARVLGVEPEELETTWIGTNHYYWFLRIRHKGRDVYPELRKKMAEREAPPGEALAARLSKIFGYKIVYPDDSHLLEFFPFLAQYAGRPQEIPYGFEHHSRDLYTQPQGTSKPDEARGKEESVRKRYLEEFSSQLDKVELPPKSSSALVSEAIGELVSAIALGKRHIHIVNIPNDGVVPNLPREAILEVEGVTDSSGVRGIYVGEAPSALAGMLQKRIAWQELVVDAGAKGDRSLALQALMLDEMAIVPEKAEAMLDELLESSREFLPQFFKKERNCRSEA